MIPYRIVEQVKKGECILFLGAMANAPSPAGSPYTYDHAPPSGGEISRRLVKRLKGLAEGGRDEPYPDKDEENLQRVSLFFQFRERGSREDLVSAIKEEITTYKTPEGRIEEYSPSPALKMLAALPFRIIVTTNYDRLINRALARASTLGGKDKDPQERVYDPDLETAPESVDLLIKEQKPVILKLHGDIEKPPSIVVTEEDYLVFVQKMGDSRKHPVHQNIRAWMTQWPMLFIGYSLKDYNFRLLFRTLRWHLDPAEVKTAFSVDPKPDNVIVLVHQWSEKQKVDFIKEDLWTVVPDLYEKVVGKPYE